MSDRFERLAAGAVSGALGGIAFPPVGLSWLVFVCLVPLFAVARKGGGKGLVAPFYVFGVVYFSIGLFWLAPVITAVGPVLLALVLSFLFIWEIGLVLGLLLRRGVPLLVAAPLAWVVLDWFRSWLFTGFPWCFLSHPLADWPVLVQAADVFGAYGITAAVVFVNAAIVETAFRFREGRRWAAARPVIAAAALVALLLGYGLVRTGTVSEREGPKVLVVQGNVPQFMKNTAVGKDEGVPDSADGIFRRYLGLTVEGLRAHPDCDVVVWPETMFPYRETEEAGPRGDRLRRIVAMRRAEFARFAGGRPGIVGALHRTADGKKRNSAFLLDAKGGVVRRYDKVHAVPGGEYIPFSAQAPDSLVDWVGRTIEANAGFVPDLTEGDDLVLFEVAGVKFAPLICYEIVYPALVRDAHGAGAEVLLNLSNYGWFIETGEPEQANQMALLRALELRRPVVVAANTGISAVISARGVTEQIDVGGVAQEVAGFLAAKVPLSDSGSPYALWGDLPIVAAAFLALLALVFRPVCRILGSADSGRL